MTVSYISGNNDHDDDDNNANNNDVDKDDNKDNDDDIVIMMTFVAVKKTKNSIFLRHKRIPQWPHLLNENTFNFV